MVSMPNSDLMEQSEKLYDQYGKPLEQEHWGEYVAIFPDGRTLIGTDLMAVSEVDPIDWTGIGTS